MSSPASRYEVAAWILAAVGLFLILKLHLLPALLAGLLTYELVHVIARRLRLVQLGGHRAKVVAVGLLAIIVVTLLTLAVIGIIAFFRSDLGNIGTLLTKMADILDSARSKLPDWMEARLPDNATELRVNLTDWLREHSTEVQSVGKEAGRAFAHILVGMVIGAMISLREVRDANGLGPLARALAERADRLGNAFRRIVFAQIRISALNTFLTSIYLVGVLPLLGIQLPLVKTMIAVTFIAGLLPVLGNLISNTVIVIVSLSFSLGAAVGSLAFLVIIHKLEYFVCCSRCCPWKRRSVWPGSSPHRSTTLTSRTSCRAGRCSDAARDRLVGPAPRQPDDPRAHRTLRSPGGTAVRHARRRERADCRPRGRVPDAPGIPGHALRGELALPRGSELPDRPLGSGEIHRPRTRALPLAWRRCTHPLRAVRESGLRPGRG